MLSAYLATGDREHLQADDHLRTYMLVVACALDGGPIDGVSASDSKTQAPKGPDHG